MLASFEPAYRDLDAAAPFLFRAGDRDNPLVNVAVKTITAATQEDDAGTRDGGGSLSTDSGEEGYEPAAPTPLRRSQSLTQISTAMLSLTLSGRRSDSPSLGCSSESRSDMRPSLGSDLVL